MAAPSLVIIMLIAAFFVPCFDHPWVQKAFAGIRAAVLAMIVMALVQVAKHAVNSAARIAIAVGTFSAIAGLHAHPVLMILTGGVLGYVLFRREARA